MRRLENVRGEFSLTALAYNIKRAINLVGVPALIAAAKAWPGEIRLLRTPNSPERSRTSSYVAPGADQRKNGKPLNDGKRL